MQKINRDISVLKKRISQYLDSKGITKKDFYKNTGISNGVLSQNNGLSEENVMRLFSFYRDINPVWFLLGTGEMLIGDLPGSGDDVSRDIIAEKEKEIRELNREIGKLQFQIEMLEKKLSQSTYGMAAEPDQEYPQKKGR